MNGRAHRCRNYQPCATPSHYFFALGPLRAYWEEGDRLGISYVVYVQAWLCVLLVPTAAALNYLATSLRPGSLYSRLHASSDGAQAIASRLANRFAGNPRDLVAGQPKEAATGICALLRPANTSPSCQPRSQPPSHFPPDLGTLRRRLHRPLRERAAHAHGARHRGDCRGVGGVRLGERPREPPLCARPHTKPWDPQMCLRLHTTPARACVGADVLHAAAGSSEKEFQNGWRRDRAQDGSELPGRQGMKLADFVELPMARRGQLEEVGSGAMPAIIRRGSHAVFSRRQAHVVALRLYTTDAFRALNNPMRNLQCDSGGEPTQPPTLAAPHPLPVTMAYIYEVPAALLPVPLRPPSRASSARLIAATLLLPTSA